MPSALIPLGTTILASNVTTVTFSNIPSTYRDLRLVFSHANSGSATGADGFIRINSDSGTNYSDIRMGGGGSSAFSGNRSSQTESQWFIDSTTLGTTFITYDFLDYSATDKHKIFFSVQDMASYQVNRAACRWANTSAITSISLTASDNVGGGTPDQFITGSIFSLYGVSA